MASLTNGHEFEQALGVGGGLQRQVSTSHSLEGDREISLTFPFIIPCSSFCPVFLIVQSLSYV